MSSHFHALLVRSATIVHPAGMVDRYGNTLPDWDNATEVSDVPCWASAEGGAEGAAERQSVTDRLRLFLTAGVDLDAGDRVVIDGEIWEVDGPVQRAWRALSPCEHHVEASLRRVEG